MNDGLSILIVVPNYKQGRQNYDAYYPIGIPYVISIIEHAGYNVDVLNLNFYANDGQKEIIQKLSTKRYDILGTGGSIFDLLSIKKILSIVNRFDPTITTLVGGRIILYDSEIVFSDLQADYGVIGDADITLPALLNKIESRSDKIIENTIYREGTIVHKAPFRSNRTLIDSLPFPNVEKFGFNEICAHQSADNMQVNHYFEKNWKNYSIASSFNCVNHCTFCANTSTHFRKRSIENIIEEMDYALERYGIDFFNFITDIFSACWENIEKLCSAIKSLQEKYQKSIYFTIPMIISGFTLEKAKMLKESGCLCLFFGFESIDGNVLKSMQKGIIPAEVNNAIQVCRQTNLMYRGCFIFGDIAETKESYMKTLNYWKKYGAGFITLSPILVLPGTKLMEYCCSKGIIKDKLNYYKDIAKKESYFLLQKNMSETMTNKEHKKMLGTILFYTIKYQFYVNCKANKESLGDLYNVKYTCCNCFSVNERKNIDLKRTLFTPIVCSQCGALNHIHRFPTKLFKFFINTGAYFLLHFYSGLSSIKLKKIGFYK